MASWIVNTCLRAQETAKNSYFNSHVKTGKKLHCQKHGKCWITQIWQSTIKINRLALFYLQNLIYLQ